MISPADTPPRVFKCAGCGRVTQRKIAAGKRCAACDSCHWFIYIRGEPFELNSERLPSRRRAGDVY